MSGPIPWKAVVSATVACVDAAVATVAVSAGEMGAAIALFAFAALMVFYVYVWAVPE